jgi:lysophospholipase L1-like esterase
MRRLLLLLMCVTVVRLLAAQPLQDGNGPKHLNIVFVGNSITYGALHEHRELTAPPAVCARWLSGRPAIDTVYFANCGRSGRTSFHFLPKASDVVPAGEKTYFPEVVRAARQLMDEHPGPLIFSMMLGTNDSAERPKNHRTTPDEYQRNLDLIIDSLLCLWPEAHVVLQRPIYYTPGFCTPRGSQMNEESMMMLNAYYHRLKDVGMCHPGHVHVGDSEAYDYFCEHYATDMNQELDANQKPYYLHPNERGAEALGVFWGKSIMKMLSPAVVVLTAGQSNADGRVSTKELPDYIKRDGYQYCRWSYGSGDFRKADGRFESFWPTVGRTDIGPRWGFDAVTYYQLEQQLRQPFYVIKQTMGGTAIDTLCTASTHGKFWSADPTFLSHTVSASEGGRSLLKSFTEQIDACISGELSCLPGGYEIKCLLWHQGESDMPEAASYYDNLKAVVNYVRSYLVERTGDKRYAHLPVICGTYSSQSRARSPLVVDALHRLESEDKDFHVIDAGDATIQRDRLHFDKDGAELLGRRVYEKLREMLMSEDS